MIEKIFDKIQETRKIVIVCGPTGSGKSRIALDLAKHHKVTIVNADSMQVYDNFPILTAQPDKSDLEIYSHKLYSIFNAVNRITRFSTNEWLQLAISEIENCRAGLRIPVLVGGTGLYISALLNGLSIIPEVTKDAEKSVQTLYRSHGLEHLYTMLTKLDVAAATKLNKNDTQRIIRALSVCLSSGKKMSAFQEENKHHHPYKRKDFFLIYMNPLRDALYERINHRTLQMIRDGAIDEIAELLKTNVINKILVKPIGLPEITQHLQEGISRDIMIKKWQQSTRNYAKRQSTWFNQQIPDYDIVI